MTQAIDQSHQRRQEWVARVHALADQVANWCEAEGWQVERSEETIREDSLGRYNVPVLRIHALGGELLLHPVHCTSLAGTVGLTLKHSQLSPE